MEKREPREKAEELIDKFLKPIVHLHQYPICFEAAKECALISVREIINSNPHSNPFNTQGYSTIVYWLEVEYEIINI
jgi:hypothetical protein